MQKAVELSTGVSAAEMAFMCRHSGAAATGTDHRHRAGRPRQYGQLIAGPEPEAPESSARNV